jgi:hypothetical protein
VLDAVWVLDDWASNVFGENPTRVFGENGARETVG